MYDLAMQTQNSSLDAHERNTLNGVRRRSIRSRLPNGKVSKSVVGNKDLFKKFHVKMDQQSQDRGSASPSDQLRFTNLQKNFQKVIVKS